MVRLIIRLMAEELHEVKLDKTTSLDEGTVLRSNGEARTGELPILR